MSARQHKHWTAEQIADRWNAKVAVGETVEYRNRLSDEPRVTTTTTPASVMGGHTAVVWLEGVRGCVSVTHCKVPGSLVQPYE